MSKPDRAKPAAADMLHDLFNRAGADVMDTAACAPEATGFIEVTLRFGAGSERAARIIKRTGKLKVRLNKEDLA